MLDEPQPQSGQIAELAVALTLQGTGNGDRHPHIDDSGRLCPLEIEFHRQVDILHCFYCHFQIEWATDFEVQPGWLRV